ncbi:MAG: S1C family serine protease [Nocardiopsaceae bacterium]|nr:S1C family serine protease [Nocardiopsaceae bacterium]
MAVLAAGAGATAAGFALSGNGSPSHGAISGGQVPRPNGNLPTGPGNNNSNTSTINPQSVANKVEPGVVDITSHLHYTGQVFEGTGIVLNSDGLVLTNNHVVSGSTGLAATLVTSGHRYHATVLGTDATDDVALLRLQGASGLRPVQMGDSGKVKLGTPVIAIGNAGGTGGAPTVSSPGTITALNRTITASDSGSGTRETLHGMLQTNAPIAEGDSGGPLANAAGQVIGMNTAANTQSLGGPGTNQGFAIPINRALAISRQIASGHGNGNIRIGLPPFMGVEVATLPPGSSGTPQAQLHQLRQAAARYGSVNSTGNCLPNNSGNPVPGQAAPAHSGTLIAGVLCHTPAQSAGFTGGDVITAVNGRTVTTPASLTSVLAHFRPGQTVSVSWTDLHGSQHKNSLKLISGPAK